MRILTLSVLSALLSAPAFAADLGTYRPGTPYHSTVVPGADVCESQCAGDARCRGWNYVKAVPSAPGVCEFQSSVSQPISSAVSISGISPSAMPMPSRVIAGDTNTIRVGTAVTPKPQERRIIREHVPGMSSAQHPATYQAPTQRAFQPMLDQSARIVSPTPHRAAPRTTGQPRGRARSAPQSQQFRTVQPQRPVQAPSRPVYSQAPQSQPVMRQGRPPIGQTIPAPQTYQPAPAPTYQGQTYGAQPVQPRAMMSPQPTWQSQQAMPRASVNNPVTFQHTPIQQAPVANPNPVANPSLYGRLNDDVRPAPVSNGYAQPVTPVDQSQLAGARR